jgi:hypothetical protein
VLSSGESTSKIERFHGILKDRTKVIRAFRDLETLIQFTDGWLIYYNYFRPHTAIEGKTPAEEANLKYDVKNWADLARVPVPKRIELQSHITPRLKLTIPKTNLAKAFKRHREPKVVTDSIYVSKSGVMSRHPFRGGRRHKIR